MSLPFSPTRCRTAAPVAPAAPSALSWQRWASMSWQLWAPVLGALLLAACGSSGPRPSKHYDPEAFGSNSTHTRTYAVEQARTCEAARRALLSQGYLILSAASEHVTGRKNFQPEGEVHLEVEFRVVCTNEQGGGGGSIAFVTAVQDRYELKKANSSASVGVGVLGSVSVPFNSGNEAMVKVASQTLTDRDFYDRFFTLIERYIGAPFPPQSRGPVGPPPLTEAVTTPVTHAPELEPKVLAPQPAPDTAAPASSAMPASGTPAGADAAPDVPVPLTAARG